MSYRMDLFIRLRSAENATIQSIMSTDLFYRWFYSVNGTRCLVELGQKKDEISALVQTFLSATEHEALWIHLMIVCCPDSEKTGKESDTSDNNKNEDDEKEIVLGIMNTLVNSFKNAKKIKTGLELKITPPRKLLIAVPVFERWCQSFRHNRVFIRPLIFE